MASHQWFPNLKKIKQLIPMNRVTVDYITQPKKENAACVVTMTTRCGPRGLILTLRVQCGGRGEGGGALQLLALVQRGGVLRRALHRQSRHVVQRRQQLQCFGARGRRLHGWGDASCGGGVGGGETKGEE